MSGGHYEYIQYRMTDAIDILEDDLRNQEYVTEDSLYEYFYIKETLTYMKEAHARLHALDYAMSGDTDIKDFNKNTRIALKNLESK